MDRATCQAAYAFVDIAGPLGLVAVRKPALHAKAGSRASVQESWHWTTLAVPTLLALRNVNNSTAIVEHLTDPIGTSPNRLSFLGRPLLRPRWAA
jgi:hypothetical protein